MAVWRNDQRTGRREQGGWLISFQNGFEKRSKLPVFSIFGPQHSPFSPTRAFSSSVGSLTQVSGKQQNNKNKFKSTIKYTLYNIAILFIKHKCVCVHFYIQ